MAAVSNTQHYNHLLSTAERHYEGSEYNLKLAELNQLHKTHQELIENRPKLSVAVQLSDEALAQARDCLVSSEKQECVAKLVSDLPVTPREKAFTQDYLALRIKELQNYATLTPEKAGCDAFHVKALEYYPNEVRDCTASAMEQHSIDQLQNCYSSYNHLAAWDSYAENLYNGVICNIGLMNQYVNIASQTNGEIHQLLTSVNDGNGS